MKSPFCCIITTLCPLILSDCDNFLECAEVKAQIEDTIAFYNAKSYKIKIDLPRKQ